MYHLLNELFCLFIWGVGFGFSFRAERREIYLERYWEFFVKMNYYLWPITILTYALRCRIEMSI